MKKKRPGMANYFLKKFYHHMVSFEGEIFPLILQQDAGNNLRLKVNKENVCLPSTYCLSFPFSPSPPSMGREMSRQFSNIPDKSFRHLGNLVLILFLKNGPTPASFSFIFGLFKQIIQILQQINVKNVHPVYCTGIRTYCHSNMSRLP